MQAFVPVVSSSGKPLMPTTNRKADKLIARGRAVRRFDRGRRLGFITEGRGGRAGRPGRIGLSDIVHEYCVPHLRQSPSARGNDVRLRSDEPKADQHQHADQEAAAHQNVCLFRTSSA